MDIALLYQYYLQHPSVQTDTRKLKPGDIFFALRGHSFDGNRFARQALEMGAAYAVIDDATYATEERCLLVEDVLSALQALATHHRQQFEIPFIAITGSNGKTTTKELVTAVLRKKFITYATEGNLNNHIGVPLTLLSIRRDAQMAVIEMGANHQKEIESYCRMVLPTHGIITNCGKAHIEGFGGEDGVRKGKGELFDAIRMSDGVVFRNADLSYLNEMSSGIGRQVTYGSANASYVGRPLTDGMKLSVAILTSGAETTIRSQLVGQYNFPNIMVAVAVGLHFGVPIDTVKQAIESYHPDNSRSQLLTVKGNSIILDAYNANPSSMRAAIENFSQADTDRKILWLGGMKEMGTDEQKEHRELVDYIRQFAWDDVVLVGKEFAGLQEDFSWFENADAAAASIKTQPPQGASILIKGSRGSQMERMLVALQD